MVHSLLRHLMGRYGEEEVIQWPIEVWNEPNPVSYTHLDVYKRQALGGPVGSVVGLSVSVILNFIGGESTYVSHLKSFLNSCLLYTSS